MVFNDFSVVSIDLSMIPIDLSMIVHHGLNHFSSLGCSQSLLKLESDVFRDTRCVDRYFEDVYSIG